MITYLLVEMNLVELLGKLNNKIRDIELENQVLKLSQQMGIGIF